MFFFPLKFWGYFVKKTCEIIINIKNQNPIFSVFQYLLFDG